MFFPAAKAATMVFCNAVISLLLSAIHIEVFAVTPAALTSETQFCVAVFTTTAAEDNERMVDEWFDT